MKTLNHYFFAIFCFTLILGCKKENNPTPIDRNLPQGFMVFDNFIIFNSAIIQDNREVVISGSLKNKRGLGLLKLDENYNQNWLNSYFDVNNTNTSIVEKQKNGDLIITGVLNRLPSIGSLDINGNELWINNNVESTGLVEEFRAIQTIDNGILAVGSVLDSGFSAFVVKYNDIGEEQWRELYKGDDFSLEGFNPIELNNGDIIISSSKLIPPQKSLAFLKIKSEGETLGIIDTDLQLSSYSTSIKIIKTADNNLLTAANTPRDNYSLSRPYNKVTIAKTESNGLIKWTKEISIGAISNTAVGILELATEDIIFLGSVVQEDENREAVLIKMDNQGDEIWRQIYSTKQDFYSRDIVETTQGFLIVGRLDNSTAAILKVDKEGNPL